MSLREAHEATLLLKEDVEWALSDTGEVSPMRYRQIRRATETLKKAFDGDMSVVYLRGADTNPFAKTRQTLADGSTWVGAIYQKRMLTIDKGDAYLQYSTPQNMTLPRAIQVLHTFLRIFPSQESKKRLAEFTAVFEFLVVGAFGSMDKLEEMYEIQNLGVTPEKQGRGYGTALVRTVLDMSDLEGCDSFVFTARSYGFYETLGYTVVGKGAVGATNPTWHHEPAEVYLMHRPAKTKTV